MNNRIEHSEFTANAALSSKQEPGHWLLVDTEDGLKIVKASPANFFNSKYEVQYFGSKGEMEREMARLKNIDWN